MVKEMVQRYYGESSRPFRACQPRDLIENLIDRARSLGQPPQLTSQGLDQACQSYFIKSQGILDYDRVADR